ncbi:MAG: sigma-E factor negative regulatory protein [Mizugakiibacter sp.]|uniref:sigma-E factor negative regulatory protein n=1 Tax=Mizugakiibacter sp. TaxID=1972610 RepID=UPI0031C47191|nr:sigma-E factor negative regulatory protein [Xanthomonadaceae bacterium]
MSDDVKLQLSAWMDGELDAQEVRFLLRRLGHDDALAAAWGRYHLARDGLRRQSQRIAGPDFAARVMRTVQTLPAPSRASGRRWLRWTAGGAIAAGVAVAALVLVQPDGPGVAGPGIVAAPSRPAPAQAADTSLQASLPGPVAAPMLAQPAGAVADNPLDFVRPVAYSRELEPYLARHARAAGTANGGGAVPYLLLLAPPPAPSAETGARDGR